MFDARKFDHLFSADAWSGQTNDHLRQLMVEFEVELLRLLSLLPVIKPNQPVD
jgi:hypothetical protein